MSADTVLPRVRLSWKRLGRTIRRIGLMAGVIALMLQVFAWTLTMPAQVAAMNPMDGMTICTAEGLVHLDADGAPAGTDAPMKHPGMEHCPLCPLIGGLYLPPPVQTVLRQTVTRHGPEGLPGAVVVAGWFLSTLQARAPPV
ncbi:DUF2946 domain-containing protein [Azospirillum sp.]|uniref:DUF2946 domain-containing protein n=1 Tax=Azospirillum sp. TaxID=34012 RepID=UPI003D749F48